MLLSSNITLSKPKCSYWNGTIRLLYNRELDKIYIIPCCTAIPKDYVKPIAWDSEFFINNFDYCLSEYSRFDLRDLKLYYNGKCMLSDHDAKTFELCSNYVYNKRYPFKIIENSISRMCNLQCSMCGVSCHSYNKREEFLYKKVCELLLLYPCISVNLTCEGEPLLYKKELFELLDSGKTIHMITNGLLFDDNDIHRLANYSNIDIRVSMDGYTKEVYEQIRRGSNFNKVLSNVVKLKEIGKLAGVNYVIQYDNRSEWNNFFNFFTNELGVQCFPIIDGRYNQELQKLPDFPMKELLSSTKGLYN